MTILIIDNYDSFTYNLVQLIYKSGSKNDSVVVKRNDAITLDEIDALKPTHIIISPGPGTPKESGVSPAVVEKLHDRIPILGVCLGHQVICEVFGASIVRAPAPVHGKARDVTHDGTGCFEGVPSPFSVGRYHSLAARSIPTTAPLKVNARSEEIIMGVHHTTAPLHGVQFHPESFLTEHGSTMMTNFLSL